MFQLMAVYHYLLEMKEMPNELFERNKIKQIVIPSSVISIGFNAFYRYTSLTQITIPSSVTSIGDFAFKGCSSLTQISIPSLINTKCLGLVPSTTINTSYCN